MLRNDSNEQMLQVTSDATRTEQGKMQQQRRPIGRLLHYVCYRNSAIPAKRYLDGVSLVTAATGT